MKAYTCDSCGKSFGGPLDEEQYTDADGEVHTFDLCYPCRKELADERRKSEIKFFESLKGKK